MNMDIRIPVRFSNLCVVNLGQPVISGYSTGIAQDQASHRVSHCGVFLYPPVFHFYIAVYDLFVVQDRRLHIADFFSLLSVQDIRLCHIRVACLDQYILHAVLDILHRNFPLYNFLLEI